MSQEHIEDNVQYLNMEHIKNGFKGYARYALDYPLKDRVKCTDYSRRKIKYTDEEGSVIVDPHMARLSVKLFSAIKDRNYDLRREYMKELRDIYKSDGCDRSEVTKMILNLIEQCDEVEKISNGIHSDYITEFIKIICSESC